ncbi:MAG: hypothetical protein ACE5R4_05535 [Armatimonadota bacterium]
MLPTVKLGSLDVTRLIIGGNPFSGGSHFSGERDKQMRDWHTVERIKQTLREGEQAGINTFLGRADNHIMRMLNEYWNEGGTLQWIAQTAPERASQPANIDQAVGFGASAVFLHGGMSDKMFRAGNFDQLRPWVDHVRKKGVACGMATHNTEVLRHAVDTELPVDFFMTCFYDVYVRGDVYLPEDREAMTDLILQINAPCIAYKVMAAARNDPEEAFEYAYRRIKATDAVCVGIFTKHHPTQVADNAEYCRRFSRLSPSPAAIAK